MSSSWWRHHGLLAICDLKRHPISIHSQLPPHEPPSQACCPGRVLYLHIEISVRAHRERQLPSGCLLQLAISYMLPQYAALSPGHLHTNRLESSHPAPAVRTGRLGVLSCLFSSGLGGSFPLFEVRRVALDFFCRWFICRFLGTSSMPCS